MKKMITFFKEKLSTVGKKRIILCLSILVLLVFMSLSLLISRDKNKHLVNKNTIIDFNNFANATTIIESVSPTLMKGAFLDSQSSFEIKTKSDMTIEELQNQVAISPSIEYTIEKKR